MQHKLTQYAGVFLSLTPAYQRWQTDLLVPDCISSEGCCRSSDQPMELPAYMPFQPVGCGWIFWESGKSRRDKKKKIAY